MVFEELDSRWERAIKRAAIRGIQPVLYSVDAMHHITVRRYIVDSGTRDSLRHNVRVEVSADGIQFNCTCESGMNDRVCWHCGAVLMLEGWAEAPDFTPEPTPDTGTITKLERRALASPNGEWDEVDRLDKQLAASGSAAS